MKNKTLIILFIILSFFLTSCIDYVQSITYKDGKFRYYCKITLSKALAELGKTNGENSNTTFEEKTKGTMDNLPNNVMGKVIDTDLESGIEFTLSIDPKTTNQDEKRFLPKVQGNKYFIPVFLFSGNSEVQDKVSESTQSDNEMSQAFINAVWSAAKLRIMISKKIISQIEKVYFAGNNKPDSEIPFYDYGESFCCEIPFLFLTKSDGYDLSRIIVVKKTDD